jgi:hypothetical protein
MLLVAPSILSVFTVYQSFVNNVQSTLVYIKCKVNTYFFTTIAENLYNRFFGVERQIWEREKVGKSGSREAHLV